MKKEFIPNISGFVDFCEYHARTKLPILIVNGNLVASFDMLVGINNCYNFTNAKAKKEIEKAIMENMYMFDVEENVGFYYPNDNMFSPDNSQHGIRGQVLTIKRKYSKDWKNW